MGVQEHVPRNRNVLFDRNNRNTFLSFLKKIEKATIGSRASLEPPGVPTSIPTPAACAAAARLCGDPAVRPPGCAFTLLCGDPAVQLPGCAATRLCGDPAVL